MDNRCYDIYKLAFSYGSHRVLDDISLQLEVGKFYGIVGPNGCGKSTFIDLIVRNRRPDSGTITFLKHDLRDYSQREIAQKVALIPQNFYINFDFTVIEVVSMGRHPYIPRFSSPTSNDLDIIQKAFTEAGVESLKNKLITELSGGERQRVIFARALAQDTPILFLDEATSNLDVKHTLNLLDIIASKVRYEKKTVIAVMHDLNLAAMYCDYLIFMKQGKIYTHGDKNQVLNEKIVKEVFEIDAKISFNFYSKSQHIAFKRKLS